MLLYNYCTMYITKQLYHFFKLHPLAIGDCGACHLAFYIDLS